eukprot:TRINITY_DN255_c0_g7_i1.p1 TRINITY_DN255_c0_g7~~TRINITY_DN255_c0_g7_i1.p1  ORF type:complete len:2183 (-),score=436.61 TRINITY_DN255_c0_g7_i1:285-6833(-)
MAVPASSLEPSLLKLRESLTHFRKDFDDFSRARTRRIASRRALLRACGIDDSLSRSTVAASGAVGSHAAGGNGAGVSHAEVVGVSRPGADSAGVDAADVHAAAPESSVGIASSAATGRATIGIAGVGGPVGLSLGAGFGDERLNRAKADRGVESLGGEAALRAAIAEYLASDAALPATAQLKAEAVQEVWVNEADLSKGTARISALYTRPGAASDCRQFRLERAGGAWRVARMLGPEALDGDDELEMTLASPSKVPHSADDGLHVRFAKDDETARQQSWSLQVKIIGATNLRDADPLGFGKSDAYCVCEVAGKPDTKFKTKAVSNCSAPSWQHSAEIQVFEAEDSLEFHVYDNDQFPKRDDLLGKAVLPSSLILDAGSYSGEIMLQDPKGKYAPGKEPKLMVEVEAKTKGEKRQVRVRTGIEEGMVAEKRDLIESITEAATKQGTPEKISSESTAPVSDDSPPLRKVPAPLKEEPVISQSDLDSKFNSLREKLEASVAASTPKTIFEQFARDGPLLERKDFAALVAEHDGREDVCDALFDELAVPNPDNATLHVKASAVGMHPGAQGPLQKLNVSIVSASGLKHKNFTGDHLFCECYVQHVSSREKTAKCTTKQVDNCLDPVWNEAFELDPWQVGEALLFTVYDRGMICSKTEGKVKLQSASFYPAGFEGVLPIDGLPGATLTVRVSIGGPSAVPQLVTISMLEARGLKQLGFSGDSSLCVCKVEHKDKRAKSVSCQTKACADSLEPTWNEALQMHPWHAGEDLHFELVDDGKSGSLASATLPSARFADAAAGFDGLLPLTTAEGRRAGVPFDVFCAELLPAKAPETAKALRQKRDDLCARLRAAVADKPEGTMSSVLRAAPAGEKFDEETYRQLLRSLLPANEPPDASGEKALWLTLRRRCREAGRGACSADDLAMFLSEPVSGEATSEAELALPSPTPTSMRHKHTLDLSEDENDGESVHFGPDTSLAEGLLSPFAASTPAHGALAASANTFGAATNQPTAKEKPISVVVGPITFKKAQPSDDEDALLEALCAVRDGVRAEGRATAYDAYFTDREGRLAPLVDCGSRGAPYYLREVFPSEQAQKEHLAESQALQKFREFKKWYADFKDPSSPVSMPPAKVTEGVLSEKEFIQSVPVLEPASQREPEAAASDAAAPAAAAAAEAEAKPRRERVKGLPSCARARKLSKDPEVRKVFDELGPSSDDLVDFDQLKGYMCDYLGFSQDEASSFFKDHSHDGQHLNFDGFKAGYAKINPFMITNRRNLRIVRKPGSMCDQMLQLDTVEDCEVYVCDKTEQVFVDNCKRCKILLGPCASSVFVRDCEDCTFWIAAQQLRTRDTLRCKINLYSKTEPIIETSDDLVFSPWSARYPNCIEQFKRAGFDPKRNLWNAIFDFNGVPEKAHWQISQLEDIEDLSVHLTSEQHPAEREPDGPLEVVTYAQLCASPVETGEASGQSVANIPQTRPNLPPAPAAGVVPRKLVVWDGPKGEVSSEEAAPVATHESESSKEVQSTAAPATAAIEPLQDAQSAVAAPCPMPAAAEVTTVVESPRAKLRPGDGLVGTAYDREAVRRRSHERTIAALEGQHGDEHPEVAGALLELARHHGEFGRSAEQREPLRRAINIYESHHQRSTECQHVPALSDALTQLAAVHNSAGEHDQEQALLRKLAVLKAEAAVKARSRSNSPLPSPGSASHISQATSPSGILAGLCMPELLTSPTAGSASLLKTVSPAHGPKPVSPALGPKKDLYLKYLEQHPEDASGYANLGYMLEPGETISALGETFNKRDLLQKAIELDPSHARAHADLASAIEVDALANNGGSETVVVHGKRMGSKELYAEALGLNPNLPNVSQKLAEALSPGERIIVGGTVCDAQELQRRALEQEASGNLGDWDSNKKECFLRTIELNCGDALTYVDLASVLKPGETVEIGGIRFVKRELLSRAIELDPRCSRAYSALAASLRYGEKANVAGRELDAQQLRAEALTADAHTTRPSDGLARTLAEPIAEPIAKPIESALGAFPSVRFDAIANKYIAERQPAVRVDPSALPSSKSKGGASSSSSSSAEIDVRVDSDDNAPAKRAPKVMAMLAGQNLMSRARKMESDSSDDDDVPARRPAAAKRPMQAAAKATVQRIDDSSDSDEDMEVEKLRKKFLEKSMAKAEPKKKSPSAAAGLARRLLERGESSDD